MIFFSQVKDFYNKSILDSKLKQEIGSILKQAVRLSLLIPVQLGAFAKKMRKATIYWLCQLRPLSVRTEQLDFHWRNFHYI